MLPTIEQRKKALLAQGRMYRAAINQSRETVLANLHVDVLAKNAATQLRAKATSAFESVFNLEALKRGDLKTLLPLLTTGVTSALSLLSKRGVNVRSSYAMLSRKGLVKPIAGVAAVLVAVGAAAYFLNKKGYLVNVRRQLHSLRDTLSQRILSR
ncbi:MAG: hypothetical protein V4632_09260 [Pseudomonadota bacterium]